MIIHVSSPPPDYESNHPSFHSPILSIGQSALYSLEPFHNWLSSDDTRPVAHCASLANQFDERRSLLHDKYQLGFSISRGDQQMRSGYPRHISMY
jgi:hypothetical protein